MRLTDRTFTDLLAAFRSSDPTPGGGSAAALAGAVGAALLAMVAGLPKPSAGSEADVAALRGAGASCADLSERLRVLVDTDTDAYDMVLGAYKLPKATDEQKADRAKRIQEALRAATDTPLDVMRACASALGQADTVARELLKAGLRGAKYNVEINLESVKDSGYVEAVRRESENLLTAISSAVR